MIWYTIVGTIMNFLGSIIFAAALIKPPQQIRDENLSYFDENPFTTKYEMAARKHYFVAFVLLVSGFAVTLSGNLAEQFAQGSHLVAILLSVCLVLLGILGLVTLLLMKTSQHDSMRVSLKRRSFARQTESIRHELRQDSFMERQDFNDIKKKFSQYLQERYDKLPDHDRENERRCLSDVNSSNNWDDMLESSERYLGLSR